MKIGIIGTGNVAQALAPRFAANGHDVVLASRSPGEKTALPYTVVGYDQLAGAELIIAATPGNLTLGILQEIGDEILNRKILLDVGNDLKPDWSGLANPAESLASRIQARFPTARVVKALNTINTEVMVNPSSLKTRTNVFVSGNDAEAKSRVKELHTALGWTLDEIFDLGDIGAALAQEHYFTIFLRLHPLVGHVKFNIAVVD
jgi:8-hydroxy-5-deazaflavin:NADPH oxidoreductase